MSSACRRPPALLHTAFYKFTRLAQPEAVAARLRQLVSPQIDGLTGSVLVAAEGINGMLAGTPQAVDRIEEALLHDTAFAGAFDGMGFKRKRLFRSASKASTGAAPASTSVRGTGAN
jgi:predicted sulfurtransferase